MKINSIIIKKMVFPLMERLKNNKIRQYLSELQSSQYWNIERLNQYRIIKLQKLLHHSINQVAAYQYYQHLLPIINEDPVSALQKFPILTKADFQIRYDEYLSKNVTKEHLILNRTGGSTGQPVSFYLDRFTVEHFEAARWRGLAWHGIDLGDPSVMIWGNPLEISKTESLKFLIKERMLKNRFIIPAFQLNHEHMQNHLLRIHRFRPDYLYGYASALYIFAKLMLDMKLNLNHSLKGVVSTAESLQDFQREVIEEAFGCSVINEYGARDGGIIAYECPFGKMHIQAENLWIEIVDLKSGQPVPAGESGNILITDLNNTSMPRLRYQLGDIGALSNEICKCGIHLPVLKKIEGRIDDTLVTKTGVYVHGQFVAHIARSLDSINHFQIIQHDLSHMSLKIVPKQSPSLEQDIQDFVNRLKAKFEDIYIETEIVDHIPVTGSGKIRTCIRNFPLDLDHPYSS